MEGVDYAEFLADERVGRRTRVGGGERVSGGNGRRESKRTPGFLANEFYIRNVIFPEVPETRQFSRVGTPGMFLGLGYWCLNSLGQWELLCLRNR